MSYNPERENPNKEKPRFRGENVLLMHYIGSPPYGEHGSHSHHTRSQDLTNVSPTQPPARLDGTIGAILKEWGHVERVA